jgi:homoserine kinase type II
LDRVRAAYEALARFHRRLARHSTEGTSPGIMARLAEVEHLLGSGLEELRSSLRGRSGDRLSDLTRQWLDLAPVAGRLVRERLGRFCDVRVSRQPCLRDARPEHFLFEGDRVSGLVDFGATGLEAVAADLARLGSEWLGGDVVLKGEALAAYHAIRPLDPSDLALIPAFEQASDLLIAYHWARWHHLEGRSFEDPLAVARGLEKGLARTARLVRGGG